MFLDSFSVFECNTSVSASNMLLHRGNFFEKIVKEYCLKAFAMWLVPIFLINHKARLSVNYS